MSVSYTHLDVYKRQVLGLTIQIDFKYNKAKKDFLKRGNEIKNIQFWSKYLGLDKQ